MVGYHIEAKIKNGNEMLFLISRANVKVRTKKNYGEYNETKTNKKESIIEEIITEERNNR